jgi:hypothetical protein
MLKKSRGLERNLVLRKRNWALKKRSCILKEGLSLGPFQNLEATSDSLVGSSTLWKGPVTRDLARLEGAFEIFRPRNYRIIH